MKNFIMMLLSGILLLSFTSIVDAAKTTTVKDKSGRKVGTVERSGKTATYRNKSGKKVGTATKSGNKTTYRDSSGKKVGTATNKRK